MNDSGLAVLLGAGFSKWAADLPVAASLFDFQVQPWGAREEKRLNLVRRLKEVWDAEHRGVHTEQFISDALAGPPKERSAVLWYIVRRLSDPYIWTEWRSGKRRRHVLMIDEFRRSDRPGVTEAERFLMRLGHDLTGIVTTNYDLLPEYALGTKLFNYGRRGEPLKGRGPYPLSHLRRPVVLTGHIPVAKMHGSISWDSQDRYTDGRRGLTGRALVVAPTPEKAPPAALAGVWELAGRILQRSRRLLVFGFAFNPYDEALLQHLALRGQGLEEVMILDVVPPVDRAKGIWPRARVWGLPPPPDGKAEFLRWLKA